MSAEPGYGPDGTFRSNLDQQLRIHKNVEKMIDVQDSSELKGIQTPDKFSGASGTGDSWYYKFKTWVESCHKNAVQVIQRLEAAVEVAITQRSLEDDYPDGDEFVSCQARQALVFLTGGEQQMCPNTLQDYLDLQA